MKKMFLVVLTALALSGIQAKGQQKPPLVVTEVQVSSDLQVPSDWLADFTGRLVDLLKYSQKFSQVFPPGDKSAPQQANTLRVTLVGFKKGSRALRYAVGFGAGQEKMKAAVVLTGPDGGVLFSSTFSSTTTMGLYGSKSGETPRKLAEKIVRALP
jgi:predicted small lipoprotein YifL